MNYQATLDKKQHEIHVSEKSEGVYEVVLDGQVHTVDALPLDHGGVSLIVDHASYSVEMEEIGDGKVNVLVRDQVFTIELLDERRLRMRLAGGRFSLEGPQTVTAPMPGKVVRVLVSPGQEVKEGEGLLVVEAMKMENELGSPKDGTVKEIHVQEGASVEGGAKLVVVE